MNIYNAQSGQADQLNSFYINKFILLNCENFIFLLKKAEYGSSLLLVFTPMGRFLLRIHFMYKSTNSSIFYTCVELVLCQAWHKLRFLEDISSGNSSLEEFSIWIFFFQHPCMTLGLLSLSFGT